jgi:hypothetical protein
MVHDVWQACMYLHVALCLMYVISHHTELDGR